MTQRSVFIAACVCLAVSMAAVAAPGDAFVVQLPGFASQGARLLGYPYLSNPFAPSFDTFGPAGAGLVLAKPDGTKFYVLGNSGTTSLQSADANFANFRSVNGLAAPPTTVAITPDGKSLLVGADQFYIVDTASDQISGSPILISGAIVGNQACRICNGIAVSRDSKRAFVLTNSSFSSSVSAYDLTTRQKIGNSLSLFGGARSITMSPQGLLYVTAVNRIYEIDPATLTITTGGEIPLVATPGPVRFSPDGTTGYLVNFEPSVGGVSLYQLNISKHTTATWPPFNPLNTAPIFDDVMIAGNGRIFAFTSQFNTLFDVVPSPFGASESTLSSILPINNLSSVTVSNELPSARFLYAQSTNQTQTTLYRVDLATNTINIQTLGTLQGGVLSFVGSPPQSGAAAFLQFNNLQTLAPGATSAPLIARVLDGTGRAIFNLPVTFTVDPASGVVINSPAGVSNADGFVQTTITMPSTPGVYTVTLTAGTATVPFTVTIPGAGGGGGGGGGGGLNQVTIFSGDGQLVEGFSVFAEPLVIQVTDSAGTPLQGIPVSFSLTSGAGNVSSGLTTTDDSGLAFTNFAAQPPTQGRSFQANTINASTPLGSVDFTVTSLLGLDPFGNRSRPLFDLIKPNGDAGFRFTLGEGDTLQNAVIVQITSNTAPQVGVPIPGVGITLRNGNDTTQTSPVVCVGSTLSDQTGTAHCNAVAACKIGVHPVRFDIGSFQNFSGTVEIVKGSASLVSVLAGNNQSGRAGETLPITLTALVSDKCGAVTGGIPVTWSVTSGTATLVNTISVSDSAGRVSTRVVLGQTPGQIKIRVAIGNITQTEFTITNQVVVTSLTVLSGNNQSVETGKNFAQPLTFIVRDVNNNPVSGIVVNFGVASGSAGVNPSSATTNAQGIVSTTVSAGVPAGPIIITATYATFTAQASLTSRAPGPGVVASGIVNGASFQPGLVPCGLASIIGTGIAAGVQGTIFGLNLFGGYAQSLNGLSISVNGSIGPIYSISNINGKEQATFQVPCETVLGNATVVVTFNGGSTSVPNVPVLQAQPGIFTFVDANGLTYASVINATDGSYVTPSNPARKGNTYIVFVTGLGLVTPATATNRAGVDGQNVNVQLAVGINNGGAPLVSAVYGTGYIGVYFVKFTVPNDVPSGDRNLSIGAVVNGTTVFGNNTLIRIF